MNDQSPPCHVCGARVACWRPEAPQEAVCMDCCDKVEHSDGETGHQFEYQRGEGHMCRYCSAPPPHEWFEE